MSSVFVDTSAFYALLDADDKWHEAARDGWRALVESDSNLVTTNYILVETAALLQNRIGILAVTVFTADIIPLLHIHWVDERTHASAAHAHITSARRNLSLVDCTSFAAMREDGVTSAFTFDTHFQEFGFATIPS